MHIDYGDEEPSTDPGGGMASLSEQDQRNLTDEGAWDALAPADQDALLERARAAGVIRDVLS